MIRALLMVTGMLLGIYGPSSQAAPPLPIDLDPAFDFKSSEPVSYSKLEALLAPLIKERRISERTDPVSGHSQNVTWHLEGNRLRATLFGGTFEPAYMHLQLKGSKVVSCSFRARVKGDLIPVFEAVSSKLEEVIGAKPEVGQGSIYWKRDSFVARLYGNSSSSRQRDSNMEFEIDFIGMNLTRMPGVKPTESITIAPRVVVEADLDYLMNFSELWRCTPDEFEKKYRPKVVGQQAESPQFEWLNVEKSRARFLRKISSNVDVVLTLFGKSVPVEEVVVEFMDGRAARATISFYSQGTLKGIPLTDFTNTFRNVGANLGRVLNVSPSNLSASVGQTVKTVNWGWKTAQGIAMLEHNDYAASGPAGQPEFMRLKVAAPDQGDWIMGRLTAGMQPTGLAKKITATPEGDVYVLGVPMVDQGSQGYSEIACCQRLFEFMQIPFEKRQLTQLSRLAPLGAKNGASMHYFLGKVDDTFKVALKTHIDPKQLMNNSGDGKRRVSQRQFSLLIKQYVDKGIPLIWALELGRFPEEPPLPAEGQTTGGHMRLIIGYNTETNQILFTDSWGAGHELKRMGETEGYEATLGVYTLSSSGL